MDAAKIATPTEQPIFFSLADMFAMVSVVCVLAAASRIPDNLYQGCGVPLKAYSVLLVIYGVRLRLRIRYSLPRYRTRIYFLALVLLLPFIYSSTNLLNVPLQLPIHKWIGDPMWIYLIPTFSFLLLNRTSRATESHPITISLLWIFEIFIAFPLWTFLWVFLQLLIIDAFIS